MTVRKRDNLIGKRHLRNFLFLGAPFAAAFLTALYAHQHGRMGWFIRAFVVGCGIALVGLIRQEKLFRRYACPDCGNRLERPSLKPGEPLEYFCSRCDVIWETGFFEAND